MKLIKSTSFRSYTTTSKVDGIAYIIPSEIGEAIEVSDEVAAGFQSEFLHEILITDVVVPEVAFATTAESSPAETVIE